MKCKTGICPICLKDKKLTKDHIIPQFYDRYMKLVGIDFDINSNENIRYICANCNLKKGNMIETQKGINMVNEIIKKAQEKNIYLSNYFIKAVRRLDTKTITNN